MTMNEFDLIAQLKQVPRSPYPVQIGIGDDAALVGTHTLITTDTLVENNHFSRTWFTPEQIGQKAVEVNVSDIVVMGGVPTYMVVALVGSSFTPPHYLLKIYAGIKCACKKYHLALVGGDITKSSRELMISITLLGILDTKYLMRSSTARAGDVICVSGTLGASAAGLALLGQRITKKVPLSQTMVTYVTKKHLEPQAQSKTAYFLSRTGVVHGITDISDGIASDIRKILFASQVGAVLDFSRVPVHRAVTRVMQFLGKPRWHAALYGGEDFEFIFTLKPSDYKALKAKAQQKRIKITPIGHIVKDEKQRVFQILPNGSKKIFNDFGYNQLGNNIYKYTE